MAKLPGRDINRRGKRLREMAISCPKYRVPKPYHVYVVYVCLGMFSLCRTYGDQRSVSVTLLHYS